MNPLYCKYCGKKLKHADAAFCWNCGSRIKQKADIQFVREEEIRTTLPYPEHTVEPVEKLIDILAEESELQLKSESVEEDLLESAEDLADETFDEVSEEVTEELTEEVVDKVSGEVTEELTEEIVEEVSGEVTEELTEEIVEEVSGEVTEELTEEIVEEVSGEVTEELTEEIVEEVSGEVTEELTEEIVEEVYGEVAEELTEEVYEELEEDSTDVEISNAVDSATSESQPCEEAPPKKKKHKLLKSLVILFTSLIVIAGAFAAAIYFSSDFRQLVYDYKCIIYAHRYASEDMNLSIEYLGSITDPARHEQQIQSVYYRLGKTAKDEKLYKNALEYLTLAKDYRDSAALLAECYYPYAESLLEAGNNLAAIEFFTKAADNPNSAAMLLRAYYAEAMVMTNGKLYEDAIDWFEKANGYSDSEEQIRMCNYELGLKAANVALNTKSKQGHLSAIAYFEKANGYADSGKHMEECRQAIAEIEAEEKLIAERKEKYGTRLGFKNEVYRTGYSDYVVTDLYGKKIGGKIQFTVFYKIPESCGASVFGSGLTYGRALQTLRDLEGVYYPSMNTSSIDHNSLCIGFYVNELYNGGVFAGAVINSNDLKQLLDS